MSLLSDKKSDFLIPDYQRPYAWEADDHCQTLWDDICAFAFPDDNYEKFNRDDEYYLGTIVTCQENNKLEVIDGQQRLTTLMLLLRAFYDKFENTQDENSQRTREDISKCIWKTSEFGKADVNVLKIDSEVATDNDKDEFLEILRTGTINKEQKSNYAKNYRFFQEKIREFTLKYTSNFAYLPARILNNCILLPIEAESRDTALRIFSTLNDRGLPLSDADIFKAQFYKFYGDNGKKDNFITRWKDLEKTCKEIFHPIAGTPMDELFARYMYYERAMQGIKSSTTEGLRKFYERDQYKLLKNEKTFDNLEILAKFWQDVTDQDTDRFSDRILRRLFVLNYAPNGMWYYFVSVYFMHNKDTAGKLDEKNFENFLTKITAFIWTYAITNPGVNALRTPVYTEMINIVNNKPVNFDEFRFDSDGVKAAFDICSFSNIRPITKSMLTWWAFIDNEQSLPKIDTVFEIEHIFAKNRYNKEPSTLNNVNNLDSLGNKSLLEKRINIRASDYRFSDKIKYYQGFTKSNGGRKDGTQILELIKLSNKLDFIESDIEERTSQIIERFISFLGENNLIKPKS
jgi:uncharacterized protein with ParB-like and HNH nuclease domain